MIHIMMDIDEHQDQKYTSDDNVGRILYLLGVNVLVFVKDGFRHVINYVNELKLKRTQLFI